MEQPIARQPFGFPPAPARAGAEAEEEGTMVLPRGPRPKSWGCWWIGISRRAAMTWTNPAVSIGRAASNAIAIDDPTISRQHAVIKLEDGEFRVYDLGSANGTYVGRRARARSHRPRRWRQRALRRGRVRLQAAVAAVGAGGEGNDGRTIALHANPASRAAAALWPAGCLGLMIGILAALCGLAALIGLIVSGGSLPALPAERPAEDIVITVQEAYLTQAIAQNMPALPSGLASDVALDLQPGNRIAFKGRLRSTLSAISLAGDVSGIVHLDVRDGALLLSFSDLKVLGFALPAIGNTLANEM